MGCRRSLCVAVASPLPTKYAVAFLMLIRPWQQTHKVGKSTPAECLEIFHSAHPAVDTSLKRGC